MPYKPLDTVYSLILRRAVMTTIEKSYISMTVSALSSLGSMSKELFVHLSESFIQGKVPADKRIVISAGMSLVRSYQSNSRIKADSWIAEITQILEKYGDSLSSREIVELIGIIAKSSQFSSNRRTLVSKFLPMAVKRCNQLDPVTFVALLQIFGSLKAVKSIQKIIESIPKVFAESSLAELCAISNMLKFVKFCPGDVGNFLLCTLVNHPEKATLSHIQAVRLLLSFAVLKPCATQIEWLFNRLTGHCQKLKSRSLYKLLGYLSTLPMVRKQPITAELCEVLGVRKNIPVEKALSIAFILNRFDTTDYVLRTINGMHHLLVERFEKLPCEYYLMLLDYALKVPRHEKFKAEIYKLLEKSLIKLEKAEKSTLGSLSTSGKCAILGKTVELRRALHMKSSPKRILHFIDHVLANEPDLKSVYQLFFVFPLLGPREPGVSGKVNRLCHQMLGFLTEMDFGMCVKVSIVMENFSLDKKVLQSLATRIRLFLEKNRRELTLPLQQLELLTTLKAMYQVVSRTEWGLLLGDNIVLTIKNRKLSLAGLAQSLCILTDNALQINDNISNFIDLIKAISPSDRVEPCEMSSLVYFVASYVDLSSIRNVIKHVLSLCDSYRQFTLKEVIYILSVIKGRECERSEIPSSMISFLYSLKSDAIAPGDLGALFGLLPHFEIDVNPVVFNLLNTTLGRDPAWVARATPKDLVEVMSNLLGTVDMVQGPFINAVTARLEKTIDKANGTEIVHIVFAILKAAVIHQRCGKPSFMHKAINSLPQKADSLSLRDIILLLKAVQISAHIYNSSFLRPFVHRVRKILQEDPRASIVELNSVLHGFYRAGLCEKKVHTGVWEFAYHQLTTNPQPRNISDPKFVDRLLNTMILSNIVHAKLAKSLLFMIPQFDDKKMPFPLACRLYNSCVKLLRVDPSFVSDEILDKLKNLCLINIFNNPQPLNMLHFVESMTIRRTSFNANFDEESVSAILILAHRINGMKHHLTTHCMNLIFKHLQAFDIDPRNDEWLSEKGRVRHLVDTGYINATHVARFADTYSKYFKKDMASIDIDGVLQSAKN